MRAHRDQSEACVRYLWPIYLTTNATEIVWKDNRMKNYCMEVWWGINDLKMLILFKLSSTSIWFVETWNKSIKS
jgi:hypothetical protein